MSESQSVTLSCPKQHPKTLHRTHPRPVPSGSTTPVFSPTDHSSSKFSADDEGSTRQQCGHERHAAFAPSPPPVHCYSTRIDNDLLSWQQCRAKVAMKLGGFAAAATIHQHLPCQGRRQRPSGTGQRQAQCQA
jgi:hypothetical protein